MKSIHTAPTATGETVADYLRRRRLEVAAERLRQDPALPVLNAALDVGFASAEAFARAFKLHFGSPPSHWRTAAQSDPDQAVRNRDQAPPEAMPRGGSLINPMELLVMNVTVTDPPELRTAYLRYAGPYGPALGEFWGRQFMP